ncbi:MAG: DUF692 domain-containing protein [Gammaproteobacteria bacterium]|nr:MAG: DUF692 domain-containing protein [Gammaproteobacteria bacterium]
MTRPYLGYGLGLRKEHYQAVIDTRPGVDWFEILTENYLVEGGKPLHYLDRIAAEYPVVMHGVSMNIGSIDPLDFEYLERVRELARRVGAAWISDHLCWTGVNGLNLHDLLPLPYTEEALEHVCSRVEQVQDFMDRPFLLENPSSYISYAESTIPEWEFLSEVTRRTGCHLLLDINNVYVSAYNHDFDPLAYLAGVPSGHVWQYHLAGHLNNVSHIVDTHDQPIIDDVWALYAEAVRRFGPVSTMIERDDNIPPLEELLAELERARDIAEPLLEAGGRRLQA